MNSKYRKCYKPLCFEDTEGHLGTLHGERYLSQVRRKACSFNSGWTDGQHRKTHGSKGECGRVQDSHVHYRAAKARLLTSREEELLPDNWVGQRSLLKLGRFYEIIQSETFLEGRLGLSQRLSPKGLKGYDETQVIRSHRVLMIFQRHMIGCVQRYSHDSILTAGTSPK